MNDFESKLKEIVEIDDSWEVNVYGQSTYYTFLNKTYCGSKCENENARTSYVFSNKYVMLYMGFNEKEVLKLIEEEVRKSRNKC